MFPANHRFKISLIFLALLYSVAGHAATHIVCPGVLCDFATIQEAIDAATARDTIIINEPVHTEANIVVDKDLTIQGLGQDFTFVQATDSAPEFEPDDFPKKGRPSEFPGRVFRIETGVEAAFFDMTIRHGFAPQVEGGGGIRNSGRLTLISVTVEHNAAFKSGGGIENTKGASLEIKQSRIQHNMTEAKGAGIFSSKADVRIVDGSYVEGNKSRLDGAGIANDKGQILLDNSFVRTNEIAGFQVRGEGAGIYSFEGSVRIDGSKLTENRTDGGGTGGALFAHGGQVFVNQTVVNKNHAKIGGGLAFKEGEAFIVDSTIDRNESDPLFPEAFPGGIVTFDGAAVTISGSTVSRNHSPQIHAKGGQLELANSTVSAGGGRLQKGILIGNEASATLVNTTVAGQDHGLQNFGETLISNSLFSNRFANCLYLNQPVVTGPNLSSYHSCPGFTLQGANANLGPLKNNEGPTETHALLPGSKAIDAGDNSICANRPVSNEDQRGKLRPQGPDCDLGAFETEGIEEFVAASLLLGGPGAAIATWLHGLCEWDGNTQQGDCSGQVIVPSNVVIGIAPQNGSLLGAVAVNGNAQTPVDNGDGTFTLAVPVNSADSDIEVQIEIEPAPTYRLHVFGGGEDGVAGVFADYHKDTGEIVVAIDCEVQGANTVPPACISPGIPTGVILVLRATAATQQDTILSWTGCDEGQSTISPDGQQGECVVTMEDDRIVFLQVDRQNPPPELTISPPEFNTPPLGGTTFIASGGVPPYSYDFSPSTPPPSGGTIDAVSGTYTAGEVGNVVDIVRVTDSNGTSATAPVNVGPALSIDPVEKTAPAETTVQFTASGGDHNYQFFITDNQSGGSIDEDSGLYTAGVINEAMDTVRVRDGLGATATAVVRVVVVLDVPIVFVASDDPEVFPPEAESSSFEETSKLQEQLSAVARWFDALSNVFQRLFHFDLATGVRSQLAETGDTGEFGIIEFFQDARAAGNRTVVALWKERLFDESQKDVLGGHRDFDGAWNPFRLFWKDQSVESSRGSAIEYSGRSVLKGVQVSTIEAINRFAVAAPHLVAEVSLLNEGDSLVSADLDADPGTSSVLFRAGDDVGDGFTFDTFDPGAVPGIALNPNGDGAVVANVIDPGSGVAVDGLLTFRADTPGAALLLHEGEATETPGVVVTRIVNVSMDAGGVFGVLGRVGGTGISSSNDEAVWACIAGLCSIAVQEGMEPDGMPGVRLRFPGSPVVHGGMLLMRTVLEGTGIDNSNNFGLLLVDLGTGAINLVSQKGDALGGATISEFVAKAFSNDVPLVLVRLNTFAHALARVDSGGLVPLIQPSDQFDMPDGSLGIVSSVGLLTETGGEDGRRSAVGGGGYAVSVSFEDGRSGIVACSAACLEGAL